jgi:hypothetical protein
MEVDHFPKKPRTFYYVRLVSPPLGQTAALVARDVGETLLCKADPPFQNVGRMGNDGDFL